MEDNETLAIVTSTDDGVGHCICSKCNKTIYWKDNYCKYCGRKITNVTFQRYCRSDDGSN